MWKPGLLADQERQGDQMDVWPDVFLQYDRKLRAEGKKVLYYVFAMYPILSHKAAVSLAHRTAKG